MFCVCLSSSITNVVVGLDLAVLTIVRYPEAIAIRKLRKKYRFIITYRTWKLHSIPGATEQKS